MTATTDGERGADVASLAAMYQEALLAHYRAPHNRRALPHATAKGSRRNPLCGDALEVEIQTGAAGEQTDDNLPVLLDVGFAGRGCAIAVASASMMTDTVLGLRCVDVLRLIVLVEAMLTSGHPAPDLPHSLVPLRAVAPFPGRHGCASMPWLALRDALLANA
jgi:nitrogen fixation NifU-like protein